MLEKRSGRGCGRVPRQGRTDQEVRLPALSRLICVEKDVLEIRLKKFPPLFDFHSCIGHEEKINHTVSSKGSIRIHG